MSQTPSAPLALWLHGISGRMGREIRAAIANDPASPFRLVGGSARTFKTEGEGQGGTPPSGPSVTPELLRRAFSRATPDLVLDFSVPEGNALLLEALRGGSPAGLKVLIGTTGLSSAQLDDWRRVAQRTPLTLLIAPNTSVGILLLAKAALVAALPLAGLGFDIEIIETHHRLKKDAPSGTARFLAETLAQGVGDLAITGERQGLRQAKELGVHAVRGGGVFGEHEIRLIGQHEELRLEHRAFSRALFATGALVLARWLVRQKPGVYGLLDIQLEDLLATAAG